MAKRRKRRRKTRRSRTTCKMVTIKGHRRKMCWGPKGFRKARRRRRRSRR